MRKTMMKILLGKLIPARLTNPHYTTTTTKDFRHHNLKATTADVSHTILDTTPTLHKRWSSQLQPVGQQQLKPRLQVQPDYNLCFTHNNFNYTLNYTSLEKYTYYSETYNIQVQ